MTITPLVQHLLSASFWVILVLVATFFLRRACDFFAQDVPSPRRALLMSIFVVGSAYLTIEFTAYLVMRAMDDTVIAAPPGYGFTNWLREPFALKWAILSKVPFIRWLPFVMALCVAGFFQTIFLELRTTFRMATFLFLVQWFLTIFVMIAISTGVNFGLRYVFKPPEQTYPLPNQVGKGPKPPSSAQPPAGRDGTSLLIREKFNETALTVNEFWKQFQTMVEPYAKEVKDALQPLTKHLPAEVVTFLDEGGWWILFGVCGVLALLWLRSLLRRISRLFRPRRRKKKGRRIRYDANLREDLSDLAVIVTEDVEDQVTIKGIPAKVRLIVLSQATKAGDGVNEDMVDPVLDLIRPGLAAVVAGDYPRVRLWPPYPSAEGFHFTLAQNVSLPTGKQIPWVLVSGRIQVSGQKLNVGLALLTEQPTTLRHVRIRESDWLDVLGIQRASAMAGAR